MCDFLLEKNNETNSFWFKSELFWEIFFNGIERSKGGYRGMCKEVVVVVVVVVVWFGLFAIFPCNSSGNTTWTTVQPVHVVAQQASEHLDIYLEKVPVLYIKCIFFHFKMEWHEAPTNGRKYMDLLGVISPYL